MTEQRENWFDRHFVTGWRKSWQWFSIQSDILMGAVASMVVGYPDLLPMLTALMGGTARLQALVVAIVIVVVVLRLWDQGSQRELPSPPPEVDADTAKSGGFADAGDPPAHGT